MNELLAEMEGHRKLLSRAWSPQTIRHDYAYTPGSPLGQSGPTALWVTQLLRTRGVHAEFVTGSVYEGMPRCKSIRQHHWTQVDDLIIDLTASQGPGIPWDTVCETYTVLEKLKIFYRAVDYTEPTLLEGTALWNRYKELAQAVVLQETTIE